MSDRYNIKATEAKWQKKWADSKTFEASEDLTKPKYYVLEMFPYPSGRIHVGHVRNYSLGDIVARYRRASGYNVLHPMGWDAFGLPAENAAIERNVHPAKWTYENIAVMRDQLKLMGLSLDWSREVATCHPGYYKHQQRMFLDFLKNGLAYQKESTVNWDPIDNTVLANEQVVDGKGWRTGAPVERRKLRQWFFKTTAYADDLLSELDRLPDWPDRVKLMQQNWIGKSQGLRLSLPVDNRDDKIEIFTTRPDTIFGASFVAIAPDHPLSRALGGELAGYDEFIKQCAQGGTSEEALETGEKLGFRTTATCQHPFLPDVKLPVYIANFVLMDYGTGAIYGVPAHDQRDWEFARKYDLPIKAVVHPEGGIADTANEAYNGPGRLANSDFINGMTVEEAKAAVINRLENVHLGQGTTIYRLRDWGVSRQRYWGCPIPVVYRESDGACIPVPEDQLPVQLPDDVDFSKPGNPLANHPTWKHTTCPETGEPAIRETDTMDTFLDSSWYYARYCDSRNLDKAFDKAKAAYWLPVDQYIGGVEHAVMHLLYARFFTRALTQCGYFDNLKEPFTGLYTQGMVNHQTFKDQDGKWLFPKDVRKSESGQWTQIKDGSPVTAGRVEKMSKSKKNVIDPSDIFETYGADAARLFILSDSPPDRDLEWSEAGLEGAWRYLNRVWRLISNNASAPVKTTGDSTLRRTLHKTIKGVGQDIENFHFNKAVARIRELTNLMEDSQNDPALGESVHIVTQLLAPIAPHIAEELWEVLGNKTILANEPWPQADPALLQDDTLTLAVQVNGKVRATITVAREADTALIEKTAMADDNVQKAIANKNIKKIIVVPGRIVNMVVADA